MRNGFLAAGCAAMLVLAACGRDEAAADGAAAEARADTGTETATGADVVDAMPGADADTQATGGSDTAAHGLVDKEGDPIALVPFDIDSVPVSQARAGDLPFFSMPAGYAPSRKPMQRAYARFPFRLGDGLHWVEGRSWNSLIGVDDDQAPDKTFSSRELRRNLEAAFTQAGAVKVFEGPLDRDLYYGPQLEGEIGYGFIDGVNLGTSAVTTVHVLRLADRAVWMQLSTHSHGATLVVVDEQPFKPTARWTDTFPYLVPPAGYDDGNRPKGRDFDMYPFWTGEGFEEVEGRTHVAHVKADERAQSMYEVRRNLEAVMAEVGGTRVFEGRIPEEASERYDADFKGFYADATNYSWDRYDSLVYRVDRPDGREVWIHARMEYNGGGWVVAEREALVQTSALLPATALRQQLDADGRVAIQVNFAVDKADILPDSRPQVEQVIALLEDDPALRLSVDGHTDATGDAAHNQQLSAARARSVVAALTGAGIDASRLEAKGHGQSRPVAGNDTDAGRARNRRVELVRLD
jgi:OOP family OmpA-OmpF porin